MSKKYLLVNLDSSLTYFSESFKLDIASTSISQALSSQINLYKYEGTKFYYKMQCIENSN